MKFILQIRQLTEKDLSRSAPYLPNNGDYEIYSQALCDDIANLKEISRVTQENSSLLIEINEPLSENKLRKLIKPFFTIEMMKNLRFVSLYKLE